jgi:tryptophan halogenase
MNKKLSFCIVGSGTAGLVSALLLRKAFRDAEITIVSSSKIGIIGVGEGSTEHWREFMQQCDIPTGELIENTSATHKNGIRFENWTNHTPDYFHSIGGVDEIYAEGIYATYAGFIEKKQLITSQTSSIGLIQNKIGRKNIHKTVNQFHFDTNKLNEYLSGLCFSRMIKFIDDEVLDINLDAETGEIESIKTNHQGEVFSDFWIDASGFSRTLMTKLGNTSWESFSSYLLCDSAVAFPTPSDPNGQIRPYTRAKAASSGWMFEIPTQERRGNGYVFSSAHISMDEVVDEAEKMTGYKVPESPKVFKFDPGFLKNQWVKNCVSVGLASSFVEPLEATSIGSTLIQMKMLIQNVASYTKKSSKMQLAYNTLIEETMRNILTMMRLHYVSDRDDSLFWRDHANMPINHELKELIDLWSETPPSRYVPSLNGPHLMFHVPHLVHVMQGQGLIPSEPSSIAIDRLNLRQKVTLEMDNFRNSRYNHELVDHREGLLEINNTDEEYEK